MMHDADTLFKYLVAGLIEAAETDFRYPYPPLWQQALNMLTAFQLKYGKPVPGTLPQILELLEEPIGVWWPGQLPEAVTNGLDQEFTLLFGGQPDDWAYEFLETQGLASIAHLARFQDELTQTGIKKLLDIYRPDAEILGYVELRSKSATPPSMIGIRKSYPTPN